MVRSLLLVLCLALAGCGTHVSTLLEDESDLAWEVDQTLARAANLNLGWEDAVYEAEAAKLAACQFLYTGAWNRIAATRAGGKRSFLNRLWSDLKLFGALVFPITPVERCALAQKRYTRLYRSLRDRVETMEGAAGPGG
jgi:hypothetical protein